MGRQRVYANDTERQRAWRARLKAQAAGQMMTPPLPTKVQRPLSRPKRLTALLAALAALQGDYEHWLAVLPESFAESQLAERLRETIDQFQAAADLLAEIDPPIGFGRD